MLNSRNGGDPVDGLKVVTSFNNYVSADGYSKNRVDKIVLSPQYKLAKNCKANQNMLPWELLRQSQYHLSPLL